MSLARYLSKLGAMLGSDGKVPAAALGAGAARANFGAGAVLQVVSGVSQYRVSTNTTSFTSLATSPNITPVSANSKILVQLSTMVGRAGANGNAYYAVYRNGSVSLLQTGQVCHFAHWNDYNSYTQNNTSWQFLDSPNTVLPVNYQVMGKVDGPTLYAILGGRPNDDTHNCGVLWTLTEIAG